MNKKWGKNRWILKKSQRKKDLSTYFLENKKKIEQEPESWFFRAGVGPLKKDIALRTTWGAPY